VSAVRSAVVVIARFVAGICARLLDGRLSASAGGGRLWSGAGD
jgi:hypothetical protein